MRTKNRFLSLIPSLAVVSMTVLAAALATLLGASDALALTALKQVQVSNGSRVDLLFDGKVSRSQIKTEFFNDVIQISLNNVSVYPAKISSVSGGALTKIFAYQYAPKLVRCRLTVKGKAEAYKNKLVLIPGGPGERMLTVRLDGARSGLARQRAGATAAAPVTTRVAAPVAAPVIRDPGERALLEQVMRSNPPKNVTTDTITEKSAAPAQGIGGPPSTENRPLNLDAASNGAHDASHLGEAGDFPSPLAALGKLAFVIGLFSLLALAFKKFWKPGDRSLQGNPALEKFGGKFGAIGRFARKNLGSKGLGSKRMGVEILANHHIGPKKSIAVIKVGGRTMVVGITEQSINLISQLSSEEEELNTLVELDNPPLQDAPMGMAGGAAPALFSNLLQSEAAKPAMSTPSEQAKRDVRVTSYGTQSAGATVTGNGTGNGNAAAANIVTGGTAAVTGAGTGVGVSAQAALGLSGVRAQIRSKLEGLKQI